MKLLNVFDMSGERQMLVSAERAVSRRDLDAEAGTLVQEHACIVIVMIFKICEY